jgi:parallel beta-helix repeat protein
LSIEPSNGQVITQNTVLKPGIYLLPQGIRIDADHVSLDGQGAVLVGLDREGRGLTISGHRNVTVTNLQLRNYFHGIYARKCQDLTIEQCIVTDTAELPANELFLDIWRSAANAYGGGVFLWEVDEARIFNNELQHQQNGLQCYACHGLEVVANIADYCSGSGFYLNETSDSRFNDNYADFCCRYQPRPEGGGHMGADAAGFVIVYRSCRNVFKNNFARLGGDGFFLAGLAPRGVHAGCDENLFETNDGSYSPNIAFEATFSRGNVFRRNKANYCNYGFWLGFSRENVLEENTVWHNRQAGIAVENGFDMQARRNDFRRNVHGMLLWSKHVSAFARAVPQNDTSRDWLIEENQFRENEKGIRIAANQDHGIRDLPGNMTAGPRPHSHILRRNLIQGGYIGIELDRVDDTLLDGNRFQDNSHASVIDRQDE